MLIAIMAVSAMARERLVKFEELPVGAQKMIKTHFTAADIAVIIEEYDFPDKSFTVSYKNGTVIEFNRKGEWEEVKCPSGGVPEGIVPQKITSYVKENFPGAKIISIEKDHYPQEYDVKLDNRVSIEFNKSLEAVEIDL